MHVGVGNLSPLLEFRTPTVRTLTFYIDQAPKIAKKYVKTLICSILLREEWRNLMHEPNGREVSEAINSV